MTYSGKETPSLSELAERVLAAAQRRGHSIVTAELCTAGKLAAVLSEAPGAAEHLHGGYVTYTKANKTRSLGVSADLLARHGAVCPDVAIAMAQGALERSPATAAIAITGVAGPDPDEDGNPVGLVCVAVAGKNFAPLQFEKRYGDIGREKVQDRAMSDGLAALLRAIEIL